jgi:hypothetical protein
LEPASQIHQAEKEIRDENSFASLSGGLLLAVSMFCAQSVVAQEQSAKVKECSKATLSGSFGYSSTGTLLDSYVPAPYAGPFGEVGRQTFDGKGNTSATATTSSNGNIAPVTIEGTYTVNPDCTGSMTLNVSPFGSTVHADFVIDDERGRASSHRHRLRID